MRDYNKHSTSHKCSLARLFACLLPIARQSESDKLVALVVRLLLLTSLDDHHHQHHRRHHHKLGADNNRRARPSLRNVSSSKMTVVVVVDALILRRRPLTLFLAALTSYIESVQASREFKFASERAHFTTLTVESREQKARSKASRERPHRDAVVLPAVVMTMMLTSQCGRKVPSAQVSCMLAPPRMPSVQVSEFGKSCCHHNTSGQANKTQPKNRRAGRRAPSCRLGSLK